MTDNFPIEPYNFNPTILREYDLRGIVGETLTEKDAYYLGLSLGTTIKRNGGKSFCIGYDGRESSPILAQNLINGLTATGCDCTSLGLGPTPMTYFALKDKGFDAAVMITGSHNPSEYNGFKISLQKSAFYGEQIQKLGALATAGDFDLDQAKGNVDQMDVKQDYVARLIKDLNWPAGKDVKIAWDNGNGAAGDILKMLVEKLPGEHILIYDDIDGSFPNHHPDPTVDKNMQDLKACVIKNNCDFGIAFDGDGDRIGAVDENGKILRCDRLISVYASEVLKEHPNAPIIGDIKCSQVMFDEINRLGGQAIMWMTGHSLVKAKMAETNSPLAGELSGHIFFADKYYGFDDALYCAIRLMNIWGNGDKSLSEYFAHLPELESTPEIRIDVPEEGKHDLPNKIKQNLEKHPDANDFDVITIDGVRVVTQQGWWLLRASNTQNCLVVRIESTSKAGMKNLSDMLSEQLAFLGLDLPAI